MEENKEVKEKLELELQWVKYRLDILDIINSKLLQMRQIAEQAQQEHLAEKDRNELNKQVIELANQVKELDEDSRKIEINMKLV